MQHKPLKISHILTALVITGMLATGTALADKHSSSDHDKAGKHQRRDKQSHDRDDDDGSAHQRNEDGSNQSSYFNDRHRAIIHDYYAKQFRTGQCPPGLAKKQNGCIPPGLAKQWRIGRPLPRNVAYYDLPPTVLSQLGPPLAGYRYVRVADDILLISIATGLVADALQGLGWR